MRIKLIPTIVQKRSFCVSNIFPTNFAVTIYRNEASTTIVEKRMQDHEDKRWKRQSYKKRGRSRPTWPRKTSSGPIDLRVHVFRKVLRLFTIEGESS